jgi:hypothetical protein
MAITGVHVLLHSPEAEGVRQLLLDTLDWPHVEAHPGWPIFALPPAELAVHPSEAPSHELSLMCDDLDTTLADLQRKGIVVRGAPEQRRFGRAVTLVLPGDLEVLLYQPEHKTAI